MCECWLEWFLVFKVGAMLFHLAQEIRDAGTFNGNC